MAGRPLPKVSVIMPTYNRADLLPRTIASVLSQELADFELLIVDDGSTDNTAEVIKETQEQDPRLRYLKLPENRGIGFARDHGLRQARGEYIAWCDSDDTWLPGRLHAQVAILDAHPEIDILFADYWNIDHIQGTQSSLFARNRLVMATLLTRQTDKDLHIIENGIEKALLAVTFVSTPTAMYRASLVKAVGGYDAALSGSEDFEFFTRAALFGACFAYLDRLVMERNKVQFSITANNIRILKEKLEALHRCERWCEKTQRDDLLPDIAYARQRTFRNLLWSFGRNNQRLSILNCYWQSLYHGLSGRTLLFALVGLLGPRAIDLVSEIRSKQKSKLNGSIL